MLLHEYGCYQQCPDELQVRVEAIESYFMTQVGYKKMFSWEQELWFFMMFDHIFVHWVIYHWHANFKLSQFACIHHGFLQWQCKHLLVRLEWLFISFLIGFCDFAEEFHRRRQLRTRKERLEKRRQQQAEYAESQKLFSQCKSRFFPIDNSH